MDSEKEGNAKTNTKENRKINSIVKFNVDCFDNKKDKYAENNENSKNAANNM